MFERLTGSNRGAIALHQEMLRLAASLMTVTAVARSSYATRSTGCPTSWGRLVGQAMGQVNVDCPMAPGWLRRARDALPVPRGEHVTRVVLLVEFADID